MEKKYVIYDKLENIGELMMSDENAYDSEEMVNADFREHSRALQSIYDRLDEEDCGSEEQCALGDIINLLDNLVFRVSKHTLSELVKAYVEDAIENTESGSWCWCNGAVESFLGRNVNANEVEEIQEMLCKYDCISEMDVYLEEDGKLNLDCIFWLDYCKLTCQHAVLFHNTKTGEKWYLQYEDLAGDEQDEETDVKLMKQAIRLVQSGFDASIIEEGFELIDINEIDGLRMVVDTIELQ